MSDRLIAACDKGLIVVSVPKSWVPHLIAGHNRKTSHSALLHTAQNKAWEFWAEHNGPQVTQRYRQIPTADFVKGGGTWEPYKVVQVFGCSNKRIRLP